MTVRTLEEPPAPVSPECADRWRWAHAAECAAQALRITERKGAPAGSAYLAEVLRRLMGQWVSAGLTETEAEAAGRAWAADVQAAIQKRRPAAVVY